MRPLAAGLPAPALPHDACERFRVSAEDLHRAPQVQCQLGPQQHSGVKLAAHAPASMNALELQRPHLASRRALRGHARSSIRARRCAYGAPHRPF